MLRQMTEDTRWSNSLQQLVSTFHSATQSGPMGRSEGMGVVDNQFVLNEDAKSSNSSLVNLAVELITPVALQVCGLFAIREGGLTVGARVITEILD